MLGVETGKCPIPLDKDLEVTLDYVMRNRGELWEHEDFYEIRINAHLSDEDKMDTLYHELFHFHVGPDFLAEYLTYSHRLLLQGRISSREYDQRFKRCLAYQALHFDC